MNVIGVTSLVQNAANAKQLGLVPFYYRYRSGNPHFPNRTQTSVGGFTPADQYQKLKVIHRTVRLPASLYTANVAPLHAYQLAESAPQGVRWNQMSDRVVPSVQKALVPTGYNNAQSKRHTSVTSGRPGCQTPGGVGCDIKHNSYDRYLNRLKGKGALRRGVVPSSFGTPEVFQRANPIYGGKTMKPNMVEGCGCPPSQMAEQNRQLYRNPLYYPYPTAIYGFQVGQYVYAIRTGTDYVSRALVTAVDERDPNVYTIQFEDETTQEANANELRIYFPCSCDNYIGFTIGYYRYVPPSGREDDPLANIPISGDPFIPP